MKNLIKALVLSLFVLISSSCGVFKKSPEYDYSEYPAFIEDRIPENVGPVWAMGKQDIYTYQAHHQSIDLQAPRVFNTSQIKVFDLDSNKQYDTVCIYNSESWKIGFTKDLMKKYDIIKPNLSDKVVRKYIGLANYITQREVTNLKAKSKLAPLETKE